MFDVPLRRNTERDRLRRYLREKGFGCLQDSVWITPHKVEEEALLLRGMTVDVQSLIFLEARPAAGESDAQIVSGAWDFDEINRLYGICRRVIAEAPFTRRARKLEPKLLKQWAESEKQAWNNAIGIDPLLPRTLLPRGYLGQRVWRERAKVLMKARRVVEALTPTTE